MENAHNYKLQLNWTGNRGTGTSGYRNYDRSYTVNSDGKTELSGSSDPVFRGDGTKYNPEEMLLMALSACHMLSYLHACVEAGITVIDYKDSATGVMITEDNGKKGKFSEVVLNPVVTITDALMIDRANELHKKANAMCFIANSCNFPVQHRPQCFQQG